MSSLFDLGQSRLWIYCPADAAYLPYQQAVRGVQTVPQTAAVAVLTDDDMDKKATFPAGKVACLAT